MSGGGDGDMRGDVGLGWRRGRVLFAEGNVGKAFERRVGGSRRPAGDVVNSHGLTPPIGSGGPTAP